MEWFEKEEAFEKRWCAGRINPDKIWKYIPASKQAFVTFASVDSDGYWVGLDEDHVAYDGGEDCRTIHEHTVSDLIEAIKTIRRK